MILLIRKDKTFDIYYNNMYRFGLNLDNLVNKLKELNIPKSQLFMDYEHHNMIFIGDVNKQNMWTDEEQDDYLRNRYNEGLTKAS